MESDCFLRKAQSSKEGTVKIPVLCTEWQPENSYTKHNDLQILSKRKKTTEEQEKGV